MRYFIAKIQYNVGLVDGNIDEDTIEAIKEFQSDKSAKEEALQISQSKLKKDTAIVYEADGRTKSTKGKDEESKEILIKNMSAAHLLKDDVAKAEKESKAKEKEAKEKEAKSKEVVVIKAKADKVEGPKVLGKIDVEEESGKKKRSTKTYGSRRVYS